MSKRFAVIPLVLSLTLVVSNCPAGLLSKATAAPSPSATATPAASAPASGAVGKTGKVVVDQTAEAMILGYHGIVNKVQRPDTQITPQEFEKQMQELKDRGIPVIGLQDLLAWRRGEKNIPPRSVVLTFDDGLKSQYETGSPILKKFGYPFTLFIYTEGVQGGHFGGGQAMTWGMLSEMRDAGVDIQAHSKTHQDLRKPYDKVAKKKLNPQEYQHWLEDEIAGSKEVLEQKLAIKVNCFALPFGYHNEQVEQVIRNTGYEAIFTTYGQPITYTSALDSLGRTFIWGNKPKIFADAVRMISTSGGGPGAPAVAEVGAAQLQTSPADGETVRTSLPLVKANLSPLGAIDPASLQMRLSGLGVVPASFDAKTGMVSYQVTQKLRDKTCSVIISAKADGKKVEARWTFGIEDGGAAPATSPAKK